MRSEEFGAGADGAREPQFQTVQAQSQRNYQATSTLDNLIPNPNGMGQADLQRRMVGSRGPASGRSTTTYDRQLWLHHPAMAPREV